jgi:lysozyme family protein
MEQTMISFDPAFRYLMSDEDFNLSGKITVEPDGSRAKFGINSKKHPEVNLDTLTLDQSESIFEAQYWSPFRFDLLISPTLAYKVFNTGANIGSESAIMMLQKVLGVHADGHIGQLTINGLDAVLAKLGRLQGMSTVIAEFCAAQAQHYRDEAVIFAKAGKPYPLNGLLKRAAKLP